MCSCELSCCCCSLRRVAAHTAKACVKTKFHHPPRACNPAIQALERPIPAPAAITAHPMGVAMRNARRVEANAAMDIRAPTMVRASRARAAPACSAKSSTAARWVYPQRRFPAKCSRPTERCRCTASPCTSPMNRSRHFPAVPSAPAAATTCPGNRWCKINLQKTAASPLPTCRWATTFPS